MEWAVYIRVYLRGGSRIAAEGGEHEAIEAMKQPRIFPHKAREKF